MNLQTIRLENTTRVKSRRTSDGLRSVVTVNGVYAGCWGSFVNPGDTGSVLWVYNAGTRCSGVVATREEARRRVMRSVRRRVRLLQLSAPQLAEGGSRP